MEAPDSWDLAFIDDEPAEVREQIGIWLDGLQKAYVAKTPHTIKFEITPGELTPEGGSMQAFEALVRMNTVPGKDTTRMGLSHRNGKDCWVADFIFPD